MVRLEWTYDQFFASGGPSSFADRLAGVLGIHASTIKVVGVFKGSVILDYSVGLDEDDEPEDPAEDEEEPDAEAIAAAEQARLEALAQL